MIRNKLLLIIFIFISACSSIPQNTADGCSIFSERYHWYKHAVKTEKKWGTPIYLQLAIIKMESDFDWLAKPPRQKLEIMLTKEQKLVTVLNYLVGIQIKLKKFLRFQKKMCLDNILHIMKGGEIIKIIKAIIKLY